MKLSWRYALPVAAVIGLVGLAVAQVITTPGRSALYSGTGTGTAIKTFEAPDSQAKCNAAVASQPAGTWMCKTNTVNTCMPAAASSVTMKSCTQPLVGQWAQTTTWSINAKSCVQTPTLTPASAPTGACKQPDAPAPVWTKVADEGKPFTLTAQTSVRYGVGYLMQPIWTTKTLAAGTYLCGNALFTDPMKGTAKTCEASSNGTPVIDPPPPVPNPNPEPPVNDMPVGPAIRNIPKLVQNPVGGWAKDMLIPTNEVAPTSDIGAFRTGCQVSKYAKDDPIVFPGQPGKSHMHTFFGNTLIDAFSTALTLFTTGNSTCRGGTINRSSYWVPSMVDVRTGDVLAPMFESNFYYKTGYALPPASITEIPVGLRMIAGDPKGNPSAPSSAAIYACVWDGGNSNWQSSIPTDCPATANSWLIMGIDFPQCWDGVNLDSPDHKSHMTNPINVKANNTGNCPASHPVALPQIAYQILYRVSVTGETKNWRLSSDAYDATKPAGFSGHGDYFMAWKPEIVKVWTEKCDKAQKDCHSHLLGDGRAMVIP